MSESHPRANLFLITDAAIYNTIYTQQHFISRPTLRRFRNDAAVVCATNTDDEKPTPLNLARLT